MAIDKKKLAESKKQQSSQAELEDVAADMYSDEEDDIDPDVMKLLANRKKDESKVRKAVQEGLIVQQKDGWYFGRFRIDRVSLSIPEDITLDESLDFWAFLLDLHSRIQWLIGDFLVFAENRQWGETYAKKAEEFGYTVESLYNMASVCRRVEFSRRREKLTFGHHDAVAALDPDDQTNWLLQAEDNGWSVRDLRQAIRDGKLISATNERTALPKWRVPIYRTTEQYAKKWKSMSADERQQVYQDVEILLRNMEEWGFE